MSSGRADFPYYFHKLVGEWEKILNISFSYPSGGVKKQFRRISIIAEYGKNITITNYKVFQAQ